MNSVINQNKLIEVIQKLGPITKKELQQTTNIKLTTLNRMLTPLFEARWIYLTDEKSTTGGRPSNSIDIDRSLYAVIGIDISRTYIKIALTTLKMDLIESHTIDLSESITKEWVIEEILKSISRLKKNYSERKILSIGIGSVGPLNISEGLLLKPTYIQIEDWHMIPIQNILEEAFDYPVYLNTGANLALLAETYFENYNEYHAAYINCGVGIRNSTMIKGQMIQTLNNREDTLAHTSISSENKPCYCGSHDCIDLKSSILGMLAAYEKKTNQRISIANYIKFFEGPNNTQDIVYDIIKSGAETLGIGIANYIKLFNLNYVFISGPLVKHSNFYYNQVVKYTLENLGDTFNLKVNLIKGGKYGTDSILLGSAIYASKLYIESYNF
ncbi:MAG: ROK family protein [Clostridiales bacterium]|nr:ROK family protein [Clostridiales bacterium]